MATDTIEPPPGFELDTAAPPEGFQIDAANTAPPAGFELDAQDGPPEGFQLDTTQRPPMDENRAVLKASTNKGLLGSITTAALESASPILGPTEDQKLRDSFIDPVTGEALYKPLGGDIEQKGLIPALSKPFIPIPRLKEKEGDDKKWMLMGNIPVPQSIGKAAVNTALGFVEFAESPLGLATAGVGPAARALTGIGRTTAGQVLPRAVAGGFSADLAAKTPEAARAAGEASVTGTTQEKAEATIGLATQIALAGVTGGHAASKPKAAVVADLEKSSSPLTAKVLANQRTPVLDAEAFYKKFVEEAGGEEVVLTTEYTEGALARVLGIKDPSIARQIATQSGLMTKTADGNFKFSDDFAASKIQSLKQRGFLKPLDFTPDPAAPPEIPIAASTPSKIRRPAEWGAEDYLKQAGLSDLAGRLRTWEDFGMKTEAELYSGIDAIRQRTRSGDYKQAEAEVGEYLRLRERGAQSKEQSDIYRAEAEQYREKLSPAANEIIDWMKQAGKRTGEIAQELDIHVQTAEGSTRPMKNLGESHYPRLFTERTYEILSNPHSPKNAPEYNQLLRDMVDNGNAKNIEQADAMLRKEWNEKVGGDFFGNAELARGLKLPDKYYETSLTGYLSFLQRFTKRASEIKAFGQRLRDKEDAFDVAQRTTRNTDLQGYVGRLRDAVYQEKPNDPVLKVMDNVRKTAGLAYLTGPFTAVRDLVSAIGQTATTFESMNTLKATTKGLVDATMAIAKTGKRAATGDLTAVKPDIVRQAQEIGALKRDLHAAALMDIHPEGKWQTAYKYGLWAKGATERLGRSINAAAALHWLDKNAPAIRANPNSSSSLRAQYTLKRLGFEGERLQALVNGDAATVGQFVRYAVREKQYGYTPSQAPLIMDHPYLKWFTQFQKWGAQAVRDLDRNIVKPALQGDVINGKQVRDYMPLVRFSLISVGLGELLHVLREKLTGKDRKDASTEEIQHTLPEDDQRALSLAMERIVSDVVMYGGTGLLGDYAMNLRDVATRGKSKNPLEPPGEVMLKQIAGFVTDRVQRGATMDGLGRDVEDLLLKFPVVAQTEGPALEALQAVGLETEAAKIKEAYNEVGWLRSLARRFAEEKGYDEKRTMVSIEYAKSPRTEVFDSLNEALLTGNTGEARRITDEFLQGGGKLLSLQQSVRARQPLKVGGVENDDVRREFMDWAQKRVPSQMDRINKISDTYNETAIAVGLK